MLLATTARVFLPEVSLTEQLAALAEAGFDGVELNLESEYGLGLPLGAPTAASVLAACRGHSLDIASVYTRDQWRVPITSDNPTDRERAYAGLVHLVEAAARLECDAALIIPGIVDTQVIAPQNRQIVAYTDAYERAQDALGRLLPQAERLGVNLCLENTGSKFLLSPLEFRDFIDGFGSRRVRMYLDIANTLNYGFPEHWIPVLGERIARLHVKDARPSLFPINAVVNIFEGEVNWPLVTRQLAELGYDGWLTAEVLPPWRYYPERFLRRLREDLDFLRSEIERVRSQPETA